MVRWPRRPAVTTLFSWTTRLVGLGGVVHELLTGVDRPALLALLAAMIGLPDALRVDRDRQRDEPPASRDDGRPPPAT
jgi:hypothetical protein